LRTLVATVLGLWLLVGGVSLSARGDVADGGFETGSLPVTGPPPMPPSFGVWSATDTNTHLVGSPVHSGSWAAEVDTRFVPHGSYPIQDFDSGSTCFRWTFWVRPAEGINNAQILYAWGRGVGGGVQATAIGFSPTQVTLIGWTGIATFPPLGFGAWHEIVVVGNRDTLVTDLAIDGTALGSVLGTGTAPVGDATMTMGDGAYNAYHGLYQWDDFRYESFDCPSTAEPPCPSSHGFWKNHAQAWPVDTLVLGDETYGKAELLALLKRPSRGDASVILAHQLIAAKLNVADGSDPTPIAAALVDSDALLAPHVGRLPYAVKASSPEGRTMTGLAEQLDTYNNGNLTPECAARTEAPPPLPPGPGHDPCGSPPCRRLFDLPTGRRR